MNNMAFTKKNHLPQGFLLHIYFRTPFKVYPILYALSSS